MIFVLQLVCFFYFFFEQKTTPSPMQCSIVCHIIGIMSRIIIMIIHASVLLLYQQVIEIGVIWKRLCEFEIKYYTTHLLFFDKVFLLITFSSIRSKLLQTFSLVLSKEHISFFRISSVPSYAGAMKIYTFSTSFNYGNHSIKFRLACCLVIG